MNFNQVVERVIGDIKGEFANYPIELLVLIKAEYKRRLREYIRRWDGSVMMQMKYEVQSRMAREIDALMVAKANATLAAAVNELCVERRRHCCTKK